MPDELEELLELDELLEMAIPDDELEVLGFVSPDELELLDEELEEVELEEELDEDELLEGVVSVGLDLLPLPQPLKPSAATTVKSVSILGILTITRLPY